MIKRNDLFLKKIDFAKNALRELKEYAELTINEIAKNKKELKYVEKTIQELIDCLIDINEIVLEDKFSQRGQSSKNSFRKINQELALVSEDELLLLIDAVSFRNEIVHSYDVNTYLIWSKRKVAVVIDVSKKYLLALMAI